MVTKKAAPIGQLHEATDEEWQRLLDGAARHYLNMSGAEFERAWTAGEIDPNDPATHSKVMAVLMLLPRERR
jgi:hypothetical protein